MLVKYQWERVYLRSEPYIGQGNKMSKGGKGEGRGAGLGV